ncbi:hypothetical protein ACHAXS_007880 [Conticribra weissflogii]
MSSTLGPSWNLRCNSSPRCLTVYLTRTGRPPSGSSINNNNDIGDGGETVSSTNPFDDEVRSPWSSGDAASSPLAVDAGSNASSSFAYSVAFGTERGSLHCRSYPANISGGNGNASHGDFDDGGMRPGLPVRDVSQLVIPPLSGLNDGMIGSSGASVVSSMSHSGAMAGAANLNFWGPINLQGAVKGSIVGIVRASPPSSLMKNSNNFQLSNHHDNTASVAGFHDQDHGSSIPWDNVTPVFLLMVDDNRGTSAPSSANPGAYAAHLVTVKHGTFAKLTPAPSYFQWSAGLQTNPKTGVSSHWKLDASLDGRSSSLVIGGGSTSQSQSQRHRREGSKSGSGSHTGWLGALGLNETNVSNNNYPSSSRNLNDPREQAASDASTSKSTSATGTAASSATATTSLGTLPRMSCVAYHPNTGFVYAAGTGIYGLQPAGVKAVLAGMMSLGGGDARAASGVSGGDGMGGNKYQSSGASISSSSQIRRVHSHSTAGEQLQSAPAHSSSGAAAALAASLHPPMALYLKCQNVLPSPGVRCSGGGGSKNSMTLACAGRVAIVAVTNSFYAVPAYLDLSVVGALSGKNATTPSSPSGGAISFMGPNAVPSSSVLNKNISATKLIAFAQSSQVHPVITLEVISSVDRPVPLSSEIATSSSSSMDLARVLRPINSLVVLASGRECAALEISSIPDARALTMFGKAGAVGTFAGVGTTGVVSTLIKSSPPRHGITSLPSPILAAASLPLRTRIGRGAYDAIDSRTKHPEHGRIITGDLSAGPLVALLTADGLIHVRSPFCIAVPLSSIEVGTRPNDFFSLSVLPSPSKSVGIRSILASSYGGEARVVSCQAENSQDFADRLIKLSIDAFGSNGFPRLELAEALGATFSATSYSGPEPTAQKRSLLRQYLECVLGLSEEVRTYMGCGVSVVVMEDAQDGGLEIIDSITDGLVQIAIGSGDAKTSSSLSPKALLTCTALLCLVCFQMNPPNATLANRAAKSCASAMGIVRPKDTGISKAVVAVCDLVADRLMKEASTSYSLLTSSPTPLPSSHRPNHGSTGMEFVEAAVWLLRSCGCHEKAIYVLQDRMNNPAIRNASVGGGIGNANGSGWSQIKFDSYIATHMGELWSSKDDTCCQLVLLASATRDLIARNPTLGLSIFTSPHPQNEKEWRNMKPADDPLAHPFYPSKVVELLKSVTPQVISHGIGAGECSPAESPGVFLTFQSGDVTAPLPLHSGRALAITYLESSIGIATGRPPKSSGESFHCTNSCDESDDRKADMHDELSYLLLEGVISERGDGDDGVDSELGAIYRSKLRRLLSWSNSMIRSERLLASLPSSFLREHALLLGRLGRHEDALKIFYSDLDSLELALEYCDVRHERYQAKVEEAKATGKSLPHECAYLPLVRVALDSDTDSDRGVAAAIQVLALRRDSIDKGAALRLLPKNVPMSAVVRPFLIPAVVENESQVRRLMVASSLLRSRYVQLRKKLTEAQIKSQSTLQNVPALKRLNLGNPLYSSKPTRAKPVHATSTYFPEVLLSKHFFPRHLVVQAQVMNNSSHPEERTLADVTFVVAESSDEALQPTLEVPIRTLPVKAAGSTWCVLTASPQRLDGTAFLTCELRYTVLSVDAATGAPLNFGDDTNAPGFGRTYVEELQDIEIRHAEFIP